MAKLVNLELLGLQVNKEHLDSSDYLDPKELRFFAQ